jgi:3-deoxy-D-manno-octulosonate 8-phosphate phosphatase (KDO 8-P phosphatase)
MQNELLTAFKNIKAFVFDVDGVLTNGKVTLLPDGGQMRQMTSKDGYALQLAIKKGFKVAVITGGTSQPVKLRMEFLGVKDMFMGVSNKREVFEEYCLSNLLKPEQCLYMGDDIPDYEVLKRVGLPSCPADAAPEIRHICNYISPLNGGDGCVRDVIEKTMKIQKFWFREDWADKFTEFTW